MCVGGGGGRTLRFLQRRVEMPDRYFCRWAVCGAFAQPCSHADKQAESSFVCQVIHNLIRVCPAGKVVLSTWESVSW